MFRSFWLSGIAGLLGRRRLQKKTLPPQSFKPNVETLEARVNPSHFRGAVLVPSVSAGGVLTVDSTSFWKKGSSDTLGDLTVTNALNVSVGDMSAVGSAVVDQTDSRFDAVTLAYTLELPAGTGLYQIYNSDCCRVGGMANSPGDDWEMTSKIFWDGSTASKPIGFNFSSVQNEVLRGADYNANLFAIAKPGLTLTYDQALSLNITSQPPGFVINTTTGALFIPSSSTAAYTENTEGEEGADYAFSGNIFASDGSQVEFDWVFDAVDTSTVPVVTDAIINANVGDRVQHTVLGTVPSGELTWSFLQLTGPGGAVPVNAPTFDTATQQFVWNSTGSVAGTWVAMVRAVSSAGTTDTGTITISLAAPVNVDRTGQFKTSSFFYNQIKNRRQVTIGYLNLVNQGADITGNFTVTFPVAGLKVDSFLSTGSVKASGYKNGQFYITFQGGIKRGQSLGIYVQFDKAVLSLDAFRKKLRISITDGEA